MNEAEAEGYVGAPLTTTCIIDPDCKHVQGCGVSLPRRIASICIKGITNILVRTTISKTSAFSTDARSEFVQAFFGGYLDHCAFSESATCLANWHPLAGGTIKAVSSGCSDDSTLLILIYWTKL